LHRFRLAAGAAAILVLLLVFLLWPHGNNETPLQTQLQVQSLASHAEVGLEKLHYWIEQLSKDEMSSSLITSHELASEQKYRLYFKSRGDSYLS
jgi:hypothetical protein